MNFWDTSALVALSVDEPRRQAALRVLEADEQIVVWWGTAIEYVAAISRRERDGSLKTAEVTEHLGRLTALSQVWYEVQPSRRAQDCGATPASRPPAQGCGQSATRGRARRRREDEPSRPGLCVL